MWYKFSQKKGKYYHASPHLFKPGDQIVPGYSKPNFDYGKGMLLPSHNLIFLTTGEKPHYTIADKANREGWYVYEVIPHGKVHVGRCWDELYTDRPCTVVKRLGNVRGISKSGKPSETEEQKEHDIWLKEKIQEAKEALSDPVKKQEFEKLYHRKIEDQIARWTGELTYKHPETSKVQWRRDRGGSFFDQKVPYVDPTLKQEMEKMQQEKEEAKRLKEEKRKKKKQ